MKYKHLAMSTIIVVVVAATLGYCVSRDTQRMQEESTAWNTISLDELQELNQAEMESKLGTPHLQFFRPVGSPNVESRELFLIYHDVPLRHRLGSHEPHDLLVCCQAGKTVWVVASYRD
ncbi:MAG: hypothetical protein LC104_06505 [Bacteroidales bacterium]|nr:hypothetical protein [Bacteroidales bacterium]